MAFLRIAGPPVELGRRSCCNRQNSTTKSRVVTLSCHRNRSQRLIAMSSKSSQVWALDFDGVVCDSVGESALSAWRAAKKLWPHLFDTSEALNRKDKILSDMHTVRPVVETGFENIVQIRCLLEGLPAEEVLRDWHNLLPRQMSTWGLERGELVDLFGSTRDGWMKADLKGWLAPNKIYPGVSDTVKALVESQESYIVTTKQARFTETILSEMAGIQFPADRIFSQTVSGRPKSEVLENLQKAHPDAESYHFVEDKLSTLEKVSLLPELSEWRLYLVDWGYNTKEERNRAQQTDRIKVISVEDFQRLAGLVHS